MKTAVSIQMTGIQRFNHDRMQTEEGLRPGSILAEQRF